MDQFIITYFCGPLNLKGDLEQRYREVVEAGFNLACPPINLDDPAEGLDYEANHAILKVCSQLGIPYMVLDHRMRLAIEADGEEEWQHYIDEIIEDYHKHSALYGYYIHDEPHAGQFKRLGDIVARIRSKDPQRLSYINLYPNYASAQQLGTDSYQEHIDRYMNEVKPALLSYDHYHFLGRKAEMLDAEFANERDRLIYLDALNDNDRAGFFDNIEVIRNSAVKYGVPFKVIVLLTTHGPYRDLTEAEIRWEVYQSLAYGASGISYFTYWTYKGQPPWNFENGIITYDGEKTAHYEEVKRINAELAVLGNILKDCRTEAVYHVGEEKDHVEYFSGTAQIKEISGGRATIGLFDKGYVMIANKDYEHTADIALKVGSGTSVSVIGKKTGLEEELTSEDGLITIRLLAGDGELLRLRSS